MLSESTCGVSTTLQARLTSRGRVAQREAASRWMAPEQASCSLACRATLTTIGIHLANLIRFAAATLDQHLGVHDEDSRKTFDGETQGRTSHPLSDPLGLILQKAALCQLL